MEVTVDHLGAVQFEMKARGHTVFSDQPLENGGFDEGMTPPELLLASVGACSGYYAVEYLRAHHIAAENLRVRVGADKAKSPARLARLRIDIELPAGIDARHHDGVMYAAKKCLIHNTLTHPPEIEIRVTGPGGVSLAA